MNENLKAFLDAIQNNEELKEKVIEIDKKAEVDPEKHINEYIAVAKEYGITLTREDLVPEQPGASEMSDEELQAVAGGEEDENFACIIVGEKTFMGCSTSGPGSKCVCVIIGGAKGCGCVIGGTDY